MPVLTASADITFALKTKRSTCVFQKDAARHLLTAAWTVAGTIKDQPSTFW
jgi:hypothetical protein